MPPKAPRENHDAHRAQIQNGPEDRNVKGIPDGDEGGRIPGNLTKLSLWWDDIRRAPSTRVHNIGYHDHTKLRVEDIVTVKNARDDRDWVGKIESFKTWTRQASNSKRADIDPFVMIRVQWLKSPPGGGRTSDIDKFDFSRMRPLRWVVEDRAAGHNGGRQTSIIIDRSVTAHVDATLMEAEDGNQAIYWEIDGFFVDYRGEVEVESEAEEEEEEEGEEEEEEEGGGDDGGSSSSPSSSSSSSS